MREDTLIGSRITTYTVILAVPLTIIVAFILLKTNYIYALTAALGLGVLILTFINTDFAIYILIFSMLLSPEFGSRTTGGEGVTIRIDDILMAIIIFTWLAKTALYKDLGLFKSTPLNKPIRIYVFVCVISTAFGMLFGRVRFTSGTFFVLKYIQFFMIYFMVVNHVKTKKQIENFLIAHIISYAIVTFVAVAQIPQGHRLTAPFEGEGGEPNTLGGYLILTIALNLGLILTPGILTKAKYRRALIMLTGISVFPFLLTNSRGSWVASIPVIIAYIFYSQRRYIIIGFIMFMAMFAPIILPEAVITRVKYTFTEEKNPYARGLQEQVGGITLDTSSSERVRSWKLAFQELPQHPFLGFGVTGWRFLDAQYMRVLIETGVIGLFSFLYLLYVLQKKVFSIYKTSVIPLFKAYALGFYIANYAMYVHGIGANTFIIIRIMEPYWLLAGLAMCIPEIEKIELDKLSEMEKEALRVKAGTI